MSKQANRYRKDKHETRAIRGNELVGNDNTHNGEDYQLGWFRPTQAQSSICYSMQVNDLTVVQSVSGSGKSSTAICFPVTIGRSELKRRLGEYLSKHPCVDCGEQDVVVPDFDHIKGNKVLGISQMVRSYYSWPRILCEINKCDVRCSNCHRKKTAKQFGWYTNKLIGSSG